MDSSPSLDEVLARLDAVKRASHGHMARCPCHDERTPSLSLRVLEGRVSCHCFGCGAGTREVLARLGFAASGPARPLTSFAFALTIARHQPGHRLSPYAHALDTARDLHRAARELRAVGTLLGSDDDEAWELLAQAAELDRQAWNMSA